MLREQRISAVIPGVTHHAQLDENVKASYDRDKPLTDKDRQAVRECTESFHAHLPEQYQWLHEWKTV
jgi:aryl-alcohol dehydrogenase-like predicted oxidoreductase